MAVTVKARQAMIPSGILQTFLMVDFPICPVPLGGFISWTKAHVDDQARKPTSKSHEKYASTTFMFRAIAAYFFSLVRRRKRYAPFAAAADSAATN